MGICRPFEKSRRPMKYIWHACLGFFEFVAKKRCEYVKFAEAFPLVGDAVDLSPWLSPHSRYFSRECRVRAYAQYLQSYRSVSVPSMAQAFGVSVEFLDEELSRFIVSGCITNFPVRLRGSF